MYLSLWRSVTLTPDNCSSSSTEPMHTTWYEAESTTMHGRNLIINKLNIFFKHYIRRSFKEFDNATYVVVWVIVRVCSVVLRRTVVGVDWRFDNLSGSHHQMASGCWNVSQHQQQSFPGLHYKPGRSLKPQHWLTWVQTFHCYNATYSVQTYSYLHCVYSSKGGFWECL